MSSTTINVSAVMSCSVQLNGIKNSVSNIYSSFSRTKSRIDSTILNNDLSLKLSEIDAQFTLLNNRLSKIRKTVEEGASAYSAADNTIKAWGTKLGNANSLGHERAK